MAGNAGRRAAAKPHPLTLKPVALSAHPEHHCRRNGKGYIL